MGWISLIDFMQDGDPVEGTRVRAEVIEGELTGEVHLQRGDVYVGIKPGRNTPYRHTDRVWRKASEVEAFEGRWPDWAPHWVEDDLW